MTMTDEAIDLPAATLRLADLEEQKNSIEQQIKDLKDLLLRHCADGKYQAGDLTLSISAGARTIDTAKFVREFPPEQYPEYYEVKPRALSKIEKIEGSARMADCVKQGARRVSLK